MTEQPTAIRDYHALRAALVARRIILQMSLADLATASGVSLTRIKRIERGFGCFDETTLAAVLDALRLNLFVAQRKQRRAA